MSQWTKQLPLAKSAIFRQSLVATAEPSRSRLLLSFLLHCLLVLTALDLQMIFPATARVGNAAYYRRKAVVYRMLSVPPTEMLPRVARVGLGGHRGNSPKTDRQPPLGRIGFPERWAVISKPRHPDNLRQTIRQLDSPPDLRITEEMKLPDTVFGNSQGPKRPLLHLELNNVKPISGKHPVAAAVVPAPNLAGPVLSPTTFLRPTNDHPHLPVGSFTDQRPVLKSSTDKLAVPIPDDANFLGTANGVVVLSVNPGWTVSQPVLPPGNREGEFTLSPPAQENGTPGGGPEGTVGGSGQGNGGNAGGDETSLTGPGKRGDGGGNADSGSISISGTSDAAESVGMLRSNFIASLVYPVNSALLPRKSQLLVSAGPMGGGGLNVYGALHCGKIYTVFLEMPGKNWTLQFCQHREREQNVANQNHSAVVHLEEGLTPPYAETKFDFRRLPVPEKDSGKLIVLKGLLEADGTVDKLQIYKGVQSEMDEAARLALSRWKFRPATRAKAPVGVDILVGIPAVVPRSREANQR